jgi:hypothetical protein
MAGSLSGSTNPKVGQLDLSQLLTPNFVRNLEESGFLPEARKKVK